MLPVRHGKQQYNSNNNHIGIKTILQVKELLFNPTIIVGDNLYIINNICMIEIIINNIIRYNKDFCLLHTS